MTHNELVVHTRKVAQAVSARKCFCGKYKVQSLPLCRNCFNLIPGEIQDAINGALYGAKEPFEAGLLQAYDKAKEHLQSN